MASPVEEANNRRRRSRIKPGLHYDEGSEELLFCDGPIEDTLQASESDSAGSPEPANKTPLAAAFEQFGLQTLHERLGCSCISLLLDREQELPAHKQFHPPGIYRSCNYEGDSYATDPALKLLSSSSQAATRSTPYFSVHPKKLLAQMPQLKRLLQWLHRHTVDQIDKPQLKRMVEGSINDEKLFRGMCPALFSSCQCRALSNLCHSSRLRVFCCGNHVAIIPLANSIPVQPKGMSSVTLDNLLASYATMRTCNCQM